MNGNGQIESRELVPAERPAGLAMGRLPSTLEAEFNGPRDAMSLANYWHILLKHRWTVLTTALVLTTIVAVVSFRMTPIYRASARVQVESETPLIQSITDIYQKTDADDEFLQTQIQVLKSESLAWRTVEELELAPHLLSASKLARLDPAGRKVELIAAFEKNLGVELVPKTRMLIVGFENPDPQLAAQVATTLVNNYIDYNFRLKYDATRQASGWMEQQLDELKAKVEKSQQALVEYERQNQIVNTDEKQNVVEQMLSDLSRDLANAESERVQKESLYHQVVENRGQMATLAHNELLQRLEEKASDLQGQYTEALSQYGPAFPKVLRLHEQIAEVRGEIEQEQNRVISRIRRDYEEARNRENLAAAAVAAQKEQVGKLNQLLVQHNLLQRDFEGNQQLYQSLLQRLKDATVSAGLRSTNIHLVDSALPPSLPVRPKRPLNIALGFLAGVVLGIMGAFVREAFDHSVKTAEEVEALLDAPTLAVIPLERPAFAAKPGLLSRSNGEYDRDAARRRGRSAVALAISEKPQSVLAEAYRALRTAVVLSLTPRAPKLLLVTSSQSGEGKTATAVNLAQTLAQQKGPVLLLDCDLRKGNTASLLGLDNAKGLSTVLTGNDTLEAALQQFGPQPNLWVLASGPTPPNPAELLASETMAALCRELAGRFEHVIIDSPPVLAVTDATILSSLVEGVILVAESGRTAQVAILRTRSILENAGARILGVVLNKLDLRQLGYYGYYSYYYYQYYSRYPYAANK
jgi:capsular exopolysaccharide synthesis family protein